MNYKVILMKYIFTVSYNEGISFIGHNSVEDHPDYFTEEEYSELQRLDRLASVDSKEELVEVLENLQE